MEHNDNDKDLRELFGDFHPELPSDDTFMRQIDSRLDAVETLRRITERQKHACRVAVAAALIAGFASGVACTLLMPSMMRFAYELLGGLAATYTTMPAALCWVGAAAVTSLVATGVFSAARAGVERRMD